MRRGTKKTNTHPHRTSPFELDVTVTIQKGFLFMNEIQRIYQEVVEVVISVVGISCDNWRKCKCEDCVLLRKLIVKSLQFLGYSRRQIQACTLFSKTAISSYISDYSQSQILTRIYSEIKRKLNEKSVLRS